MAQLTVSSITRSSGFANARLVLPFDLRQRSRLLASIDSGEEIGLTLPRGTVLRGGDRLQASDGRIIDVVAAPERVAIVQSDDPRLLARAAYHLGNRHVAVQITSNSLRFLSDHVLEGMLQQLGLSVEIDNLPFEPEAGAYAQSGHGHGHGHAHGVPERRGGHQ